MLQFVVGSSIRLGERVECYYSKNKNMISVRSLDNRNKDYGRIVAYAEYIHIENAIFSYRNGRKVVKGNYIGGIPIVPNSELIILSDGESFYTTEKIEVVGAKYCVYFLDMILAERVVENGGQQNSLSNCDE